MVLQYIIFFYSELVAYWGNYWYVFRKGGDQIEELDGALMDWDLKEFGWDSTELDPKEDDDDLVLDFISSVRAQKSTTPPSSEGLKLGSFMAHDPTEQRSLKRSNDNSKFVSSPSGSSKRFNGSQKLSCLVDGCKADLSGCREYHKRHRVCEHHSKTPSVTVKGEEKRFCQQCSRYT